MMFEWMDDLTFDEYLELSLDGLALEFPDIELVAAEDFMVDGLDGVMLVYVSEAFLELGIYGFVQFIIDVYGWAYIFTYTSTGDVDFLDDVAWMIDTFELNLANWE